MLRKGFGARPVSDRIHFYGRNRAVRLGKHRYNRRPCRSRQLPADIRLLQRRSSKNFERGRGGDRIYAMVDSYFPFAYGDRRGLNGFNTQLAEQNRSADNIDNGVHGTDLMKMHVLHRHAMNFPFRFRDFLEYSKGEFLNGLFKPGMLNELGNILVRSVIMMMVMRMSMIVAMAVAVIMHMSVRMIVMRMVMSMLIHMCVVMYMDMAMHTFMVMGMHMVMLVLMAVSMALILIMHMFVLVAVTMFMIVRMCLIVLMFMSVCMLMVMRVRAAIFQQHIEFG